MHYQLEEIADGVLAAIATPGGGGMGNAAIVRLDGRTVVFDTGMTPQAGAELRQAAERLGPVGWVVNSHWHGDHIPVVEMHPWMGAGDPDRWIEILGELESLDVDRFVPGHGRVATVDDVRALREHLRAFLADPDGIESLYPDWDFWEDTADRNREFLRERGGRNG